MNVYLFMKVYLHCPSVLGIILFLQKIHVFKG